MFHFLSWKVFTDLTSFGLKNLRKTHQLPTLGPLGLKEEETLSPKTRSSEVGWLSALLPLACCLATWPPKLADDSMRYQCLEAKR